jgi:RNA polymerase sigma-70 factor (ECF subfamily)
MAALEAPVGLDVAPSADPDVENELVARIRGGDEAAFQIVYDRYFRRVYHFLDKRLRNRADTEETVQEVFINVFSSIESFRGDAPFAAWVFGITRRTLAGRFKRKRHPMISLADVENDSGDLADRGAAGDPLAAYEYREQIDRMAAVMRDKLSAEQRQLVERHHLRHQSIQDIAREMRKSEDAVKSNLYRARKLLLAR